MTSNTKTETENKRKVAQSSKSETKPETKSEEKSEAKDGVLSPGAIKKSQKQEIMKKQERN